MLSSFSWDTYYNNSHITETHQNEEFISTNQTLKPTQGNTYVLNCFFFDLHTSSSGGAVFYSLNDGHFLIEQCSINKCSAEVYAGGIRIEKGDGVIALTCSQNGYVGDSDSFCSITAYENRKINIIIETSASHCKAERLFTATQRYGSNTLKAVNMSHNIGNSNTVFGCYPNNVDNDGRGIIVSFCSFTNNTATDEQCLILSNALSSIDMTFEIKNSNIIYNNATKTIYSKGKTTISYCSIFNNGDPCFYPDGQNSSIDLINSYSNNPNEQEAIAFSSSEPSYPIIVALTFVKTGQCYISKELCQTIPERNILIRKFPITYFMILGYFPSNN